jgi:hypothetical protein
MITGKSLFRVGTYPRAPHDPDGHAMLIAIEGMLSCALSRELISEFLFVPDGGAQGSSVPICRGGPPLR